MNWPVTVVSHQIEQTVFRVAAATRMIASLARLVTMSPRSARPRRSFGWPVVRRIAFANVAVFDRPRSRSTGWLIVMHNMKSGAENVEAQGR